ncbi:MAG: TonB-dependent receptor, partial [Candidatus Kapaibacterium sp.]
MKYRLIFFLWLLPFSLLSEDKYSISGIVNDDTSKEAVISATVALYTDSIINKDNFVKGAYSNKFGFYSLPHITNGTYYLAVSSVGYKLKLTKLTVANDDVRENVQLESTSAMTEEVTVTADRESSPTSSISSVSISPSFVSKMPAFGGEVDIFRTLQLLPGIAAGSELSSGLYVRGGSPDQNLILLDGVTVYNPSHLAGFISSFNNDAIKDIRMIKGAFPAEYGGRLSSVLDLTMKEGRKDKVGGKAGISLISSKLTVEGPINENSSFMISGRRFYFDLLLGLITNDAPTYYFYDFNAKANYKLSENDVLYVSGYFARDVFGVNENENDDISVNWGNSTANMRWMHIVSPELFTNFSLVYTDYIFESNIGEDDVVFNTGSRIRDIVLKGDAQYLAYDNHIIKTGADITWHNFNANANFNDIDFDTGADFLGEGNINTFDIALYAQDEWKVDDRMDVNYGLRGYYFQQGNYLDIEPRVSATYLTDEGIRLKGAFAVANQYIHLVVRNNISLPTDLWFPSTENILP